MSGFGRLEMFLVLLLLLGAGLHVLLRADPSQRNWEYFPDMAVSPAYATQDPCTAFPNLTIMQQPPPGTIARGFLPPAVDDTVLETGTEWAKLTPEERSAWVALRPPWSWEALDEKAQGAVLRRGRHVYETYCSVCHGVAGAGGPDGGPVTKRGVPPPASLTDTKAKDMSAGQMFRVITHGKGNMASYASQVERSDRWMVIRYIRSLQQQP